ncbi:MAG: Type 1 glutamine amidotransferase-like domain-containing protein [Acholeplasmataceae bacterium]
MKQLLLSRTILNQPFVHQTLKHHLGEEDKVLVILYSFFKMFLPTQEAYDELYATGGEYDKKIQSQFGLYGAKVKYLNYYHDDEKTRLEKISHATVLFFPGGAPDEMLERFKEHDLIEPLITFKGMTIGSSAGAMIQAKQTHIYKDHEYFKFSYFHGLGYIEGFDYIVHYRRRIQQKKAVKKVFREYPQNIYAIPDDGALFVEDGHVTCLGNARQLYNKKGVVK